MLVQNVANLVWSYATLGVVDDPLMASISAAAVSQMEEMDSQNLSNIAWAFAVNALEDLPLFDALASRSINQLSSHDGDAQHLSNMAWSFATIQYEHGPLFTAISAASLRSIAVFEGLNISNTFWSFATLSRRDGPLLDALASAAILRITYLAAQDLSNSVWSCARLAFCNLPLLDAIASRARASSCQFVAQDLANTVWAFAYFLYADGPLFEAISEAAMRKISDFISQNMATTAWALEELDCIHEPLLHALSKEVLLKIDSMDFMPMATLLDRRLWPESHAAMASRLFPLIDDFCARLLQASSLEFWRGGGYQHFVLEFGVGNFGAVGGRYLYSKLGIFDPDEDFLLRASGHVPRIGRMMADTYVADGADFLRQRVVTYAEFELRSPDLREPLRGSGCHENGRTYASSWIAPVRPPLCPYADRGTCSEFRMLASFCDAIAQADPQGTSSASGRAEISGFVRALVSGPCCVSCVGAFAQFRRLFPAVVVSVAAGGVPEPLQP
mmetsp:Transcript_28243/g.93766  ORF Transcript_28243/g.93766 Transcript_28243/m.93766 type:complete len:502 (+) Transcript_28243:498-2003(+)